MRRLAPLCLGLGLSLAVGAPASAQQPTAPGHAMHLCAKCAKNLPKRLPASGPTEPPPGAIVVAGGDCVACQQSQGGVIVGEAAGLAYVGGPSGGEAPGLAQIGGPMGGVPIGFPSSEPAPIGVMRTNYAQPTAPAAGPIDVMAHGQGSGRNGMVPAGMMGPSTPPPGMMARPGGPNPNAGRWAGTETSMMQPGAYPGTRKPGMMRNLFGMPRSTRMGAAQEARKREMHAMERYDALQAAPANLPASAVYGGGPR